MIVLMIDFYEFSKTVGEWLNAAGVIIIFGGFISASLITLVRLFSVKQVHHLYRSYRHNLSRSILLGLEFFVAGDVIRSVAGDLNMRSVGALAILIVIRLLLGISLEMEIAGHWPWQRARHKRAAQD